ncbi:threonylcarbamoyladenosine tRNA methylthiotransferase [Polymixia lowei]
MPSGCDSLIEDIEDMVSASDPTPQERQSARKSIIPRARKRKEQLTNEELQADSLIPGTQTIWMRTWGCSHNNSDGEYMAGQLAASGYKMTDDPSEADLWLLNSCTVKNPAEDHFRNSIKKAQEQQKKVVVAGCVPQAQPRMDYLKGLSIIGVQQIDRVVEVVDEAVKGHSVRLLGQKKDGRRRLGGARLDLPKIRKNPLIEIISINTGVPGITIATDIICGFPGETEADFQETVDLVGHYRFPSLFINQFYPRPGTPAAKMEQVPAHVKKQRTKELSQLFHSYNPYDHKIGERQHVLVTEESFDAQYYVAHNKFYEQVLVPKRSEFKGKMIEVDIYEAGKHFLKGRPVDDSKLFTPSIATPLQKGEVSGLMQEQTSNLANGVNGSTCTPSSPGLLIGSYSLDSEGLKMLGVGLAVVAAIIAFILEKLY